MLCPTSIGGRVSPVGRLLRFATERGHIVDIIAEPINIAAVAARFPMPAQITRQHMIAVLDSGLATAIATGARQSRG